MNESDLAALLKANPDLRAANTGGLERPPLIPDIGNRTDLDADEDHAQMRIVRWAEENMDRLPELRWLFHVPNGGKRDKATAARMKRMGVKAGIPDLWLPVPRGPYHGLIIELKHGSNKPTADQLEWIDHLNRSGWYACWDVGSQAAIETIVYYLTGESPK